MQGKTLLTVCVLAAILAPFAVFAEVQQTTLIEPLSIGSVIQVFAGLAAVLILFGVVVFLLKRVGGFRSAPGGKMRLIDGVSVGTRERVILMQIGEKQVLIGVSPGRVSPIHVFDEPVITASDESTGFAGQLQKQLQKRQLKKAGQDQA